jgi:hypothetical protein
MPNPGWLKRQFEKVDEDIKTWPPLLRRVSGLEDVRDTEPLTEEKPEVKRASAGSNT